MKKILLYSLLIIASMSLSAQEVLPYPTETIDGKVYYLYTVERSIGLYRISKNFGVSQEEILQANPDLRTRGLRFEEVIRIPARLPETPKAEEVVEKSEPAEQTAAAVVTAPVVSEPVVSAPIAGAPEVSVPVETEETAVIAEQAEALPDTLPEAKYIDTVRLAYLLPLQADVVQRSPTIDRFYDFYTGSLLALKHQNALYVDSLGDVHSIYYDVHTYDVGKDTRLICQLMDSDALAQMDAIVGPAYYQQVKVVSEYVKAHQIPVMVPFLPSVPDITANPYLLKFNAFEDTQVNALMEYLDTLRSSTNIVLVDAYQYSLDYATGIRKMRDSIVARQLPHTRTTIRQILADSVGVALKDSVENILLFHSERYSNVQLLMPYLLSGKRGKQLTILSQYSWQTEHILLPQLFVSVFGKPEGEAFARYEQDYAQYFGHPLSSLHPRFDLLGYDLTRFMLEALKGGTFQVPDSVFDGLQSSILLTPIENGGYENTHVVVERR